MWSDESQLANPDDHLGGTGVVYVEAQVCGLARSRVSGVNRKANGMFMFVLSVLSRSHHPCSRPTTPPVLIIYKDLCNSSWRRIFLLYVCPVTVMYPSGLFWLACIC